MKRLIHIVDTIEIKDVAQFLGTGLCLLVSKIAPFLAVVALVYQIKMIRIKAKREELKYRHECYEENNPEHLEETK